MTEPKQIKTDVSAHLVVGDDEFVIERKARTLVETLCPEASRDFGLEIIEGARLLQDEAVQALQQTIQALRTVGFLSGLKVVWLREASFLGERGGGATDEAEDHEDEKASGHNAGVDLKTSIAQLADLLEQGFPDGHQLVISTTKINRRGTLFKAIKKCGALDEIASLKRPADIKRASEDQVAAFWAEFGLKPAGRGVLQSFMQKAGSDSRMLRQETAKLASYVGVNQRVTEEDLAAIVSLTGESPVWDLADRVGERNLPAALAVLHQLYFQREHPMKLIYGLESRFRQLLVVKECIRRRWLRVEGSDRYGKAVWSESPEDEGAATDGTREIRSIHPFRQLKLCEQAERYTLRELLLAQQELAKTHEQLLSSVGTPELMLELAVMSIVSTRNVSSYPNPHLIASV